MEKRWAGRVAECSGLENRRRFVAFPGFESLAHRHFSLEYRQLKDLSKAANIATNSPVLSLYTVA